MTEQDQNKALAARWFEELWNQGRIETIDELFAADGLCYGFPTPESVITHAEFKAGLAPFRAAFSDIHCTVDEMVAEADTVALRWTITLRHTGDSLGYPASQKLTKLQGAGFMQCRNGQMVTGRNYLDMTNFHQTLQSLE